MIWEEKSFTELGSIGRGKSRHRPRNDETLYGGLYPMIQTGEVKAADFYLSSYTKTYNEKGLAQSKLWQPETLCITIAANIAETAILSIEACFPDSIIGFIADVEKCDVRFIKYFFDIYKKRMQQISQGATQDNLSLEKLLTFKVPTPPLPTQKKIAGILSAYDNLIENNLKRIKLLEEAAQNIYREWFVHFRYPGHEDVPINDETGLPEGWERRPIGNYVDLKQGFAVNKKSKHHISEIPTNFPLLKISDLIKDIKTLYVKDSIPSQFLVFENEIIFSRTGQVGLAFTNRTGVVYNNCFKVIPFESIDRQFLFQTLITTEFVQRAKTLASGAAQPDLNHGAFKSILITLPAYHVQMKFKKIVRQIELNILNSQKQNRILKEARDILLPRLMNQTIEI